MQTPQLYDFEFEGGPNDGGVLRMPDATAAKMYTHFYDAKGGRHTFTANYVKVAEGKMKYTGSRRETSPVL